MPGFFHDTLGERDRAIAITQIRQFVQARFAQPPVRAALRDAHRAGPSFEEAERLAWPPQRNSLQDLRWRGVRAGLRLGGRLSE
ncbi:alpha/beta hydrolase, partial [Xanthomonas oryzae pv. oryzae]